MEKKMNKFLVPAILTAAIGLGSAAMAADASGVVKTWDPASHTLTLADGTAYILPAKFSKADAFKVGEKVKISFDLKAGKNMATMAAMAG
jgi:hypothetical protein